MFLILLFVLWKKWIRGCEILNTFLIFRYGIIRASKLEGNTFLLKNFFLNGFTCFMKKMNKRLWNTKYIFNIPVWNNSGIKIRGKHVFIENFFLNGFTSFGDFFFFNENGIILSRKDFMERFHLPHIPPKQYKSFMSAIRKYTSFY